MITAIAELFFLSDHSDRSNHMETRLKLCILDLLSYGASVRVELR